MSFAPDTETFAKPEVLMRVPVGFASPLWGLFAGAAVSGAAWWWMTRWTRAENLEAIFGAAAKFEAAVEPKLAVLAAPVAEAVQSLVEPTVEALVEATPEPLAETVETLAEVPLAAEPVGGEAAPISPVVEASAAEAAPQPTLDAEPTPKPKKPAAPKPA